MTAPAAKRTTVPDAWAGRPDDWWAHVDNCATCARWWERPPTIPAGTLEVGDTIVVEASGTFEP